MVSMVLSFERCFVVVGGGGGTGENSTPKVSVFQVMYCGALRALGFLCVAFPDVFC